MKREKKTAQPDYYKNYNHAYYLAHKEKMNARSKKWMKDNSYRRKKISEIILDK